MQHLEEGTIHAWLDGALDDLEAARVAKHAADCEACAAMVAEARGLIAGASRIVSSLDVVRGGVIPPVSGGDKLAVRRRTSLWGMLRLTPPRAAIAATVLVAVGSMLAVREVGRDAVPARSTAVADRPASASEAIPAPTAPTASTASAVDSSTAPAPRDMKLEARASAKVAAANEAMQVKASPLEKQVAGGRGAATRQLRESQPAPSVASAVPPPSAAPIPAAPTPASGRVAGITTDAISSVQRKAMDAGARTADSLSTMRRARSDSTRLRAEEATAAQTRSAFAQRPQAMGGVPTAAAGCYVILGTLPPWAAALPQRFALDLAPAADTVRAPQRRAVRAIVDGRLDSAVGRASWRVLPDAGELARIAVDWPTTAGAITLTFAPIQESNRAASVVTISDPTHSQPIMLARTACSTR